MGYTKCERKSFDQLPDVLLPDDLCKVLPYARSYMKRLVYEGKIPTKKLGHKRIILKKDLINWLENLK